MYSEFKHNMNIHIELPRDVVKILAKLEFRGHKACVVGGCVRDSIIGREVHDWDIATSATPDQVIDIFGRENVIGTGIEYGTVTVRMNGVGYEVTTFRSDSNYSDGRRPDKVVFTDDLHKDLYRRDFTMNAIAYHEVHGFYDPFNGIGDIENKTIRCVGWAKHRLREDGLRIMRALRFAAQLKFNIDYDTSYYVRNYTCYLENVAAERIQSELCKILLTDQCGFAVFRSYPEVICKIIPEFGPMIGFDMNEPEHIYDAYSHTWHSMMDFGDYSYYRTPPFNVMYDIVTRLAVLLHDIGKPHCDLGDHAEVSAKMAYKILRRLKFSNEIVAYTTQLISYHMYDFNDYTKPKLKILVRDIGKYQVTRLFKIRLANYRYGTTLAFNQNRILCNIVCAEREFYEILANDECCTLKQLAVNGDDIVALGIEPGKKVGRLLDTLLSMVIDGLVENDREELIGMLERIKEEEDNNGGN